jgi:4'-phosphopantetheinyl transferase EntD
MIATWIAAHAPPGTAVAEGPIADGAPFDAAEAAAIAPAVERRRREFLTGRALARAALARLGCPPCSIPVGESRAPVWPDGFLGSISHSRSHCVAHVARSRDLLAVGIDIEAEAPLAPGLAALICRPDETGEAPGLDPVLARFAAKEAFYKAYFPVARRFLDFHDVRVDLAEGRFVAELVADKPALGARRTFEGRIARLAGHTVAALWIAREPR